MAVCRDASAAAGLLQSRTPAQGIHRCLTVAASSGRIPAARFRRPIPGYGPRLI
jgi:hypothetical protein